MSFIKKLMGSLSILCAFGCSNSNDEQERKDLLKWLDFHIAQISQQIESDIAKEKKGFYPHSGKTSYSSKGFIEYELQEKTGQRLEISQRSLMTLNDIKNTDAYQQLVFKINKLSLQLEINEINIDGDEVESYVELDEYIDDIERYFVITISGWQPEIQ